MYNSKITGRLQEMIQGSYVENNGVEYTTDRDGSMIRVERPTFQTKAAREGLKAVETVEEGWDNSY